MIQYISSVDILTIDENGKEKWDRISHVFEDENMIIARNEAIADLKCLIAFFLDESYTEIRPYHLLDIVGNELRYTNRFIPELTLIGDGGWPTSLYGDNDTVIEGLDEESIYYFRDSIPHKMAEIEDEDGNTVEVLESNLIFFLSIR